MPNGIYYDVRSNHLIDASQVTPAHPVLWALLHEAPYVQRVPGPAVPRAKQLLGGAIETGFDGDASHMVAICARGLRRKLGVPERGAWGSDV